ncbi:hypothetical protein E1180_05550 [Roseibium denhamense]|uniref:DNA 3'-5' helicase II n=1 Tax=Roseibium denhamense TaxID=76305 RepID=A0ABY1PFQ2_9HYPH|nr:ATP-binding domain-containing protein [Roseibium denhamense]MTI04978.1 hypothetical protein [Roseibium denhamense]SMP33340.1 UvrD-like helicase C-terminal domain-containing protein [Roseibium denhamense]
MSRDHVLESFVCPVAEEALSTFSVISQRAKEQLLDGIKGGGPSAFASMNTFTDSKALNSRKRIDDEIREGYRILSEVPSIARVVVVDEQDDKTTFYFSRTSSPALIDPPLKFASYRSPVGRLAELDVGDELELPRGGGESIIVEIIEHARFQPIFSDLQWDGRNAILEGVGYGPISVQSLRALLKTVPEIDESFLDELLREEDEDANVRKGIRRAVISSMDLRDQPVLDKYQGEIFRMPLGSRLLILGAPGTGKTTTLIRRLGQKLDLEFLDDAERRAIRGDIESGHNESWIMFTPTELLKLYVKEAFSREGIPAPDSRIQTWSEMRTELARNEFRILRTAASKSSLVMKDTAKTIDSGIETRLIDWFSDFDQWQRGTFWEELHEAAKRLSENPLPSVSSIGTRILEIVEKADDDNPAADLLALTNVAVEIGSLLESMKKDTDDKIRQSLNVHAFQDKSFLDEMAAYVASLEKLVDDDFDPDEEDEEEEVIQTRGSRSMAATAYMNAMRTLARAKARRRSLPKTGPTSRLLEWLGEKTLPEETIPEVGESLVVQAALRIFSNPVGRYIDRVPSRYRGFRRVRQAESRWYRTEGIARSEVHPLEVDVMLLTMLREADQLITGARDLMERDTAARRILRRMEQLYRTQILVDEATDFSPIQLACMATMARPGTRSFFACGDFNQRVTNWGTRTDDEMRWVLPDIATKTVTVAYRQSGQLHNFAKQLIVLSGGSEDDAVLPKYTENDGVPPVLAKGMNDIDRTASWLASRIVEIEKFVGELPSIAVLVNSEEEVSPIAKSLSATLEDQNISVQACPDGQVRGRESAVRVFNVQHIKGLEFEAVFFLGVDGLAQKQPDLFDKYLYVGATRAATYLGLTCEADLPPALSSLESLFETHW